MSALTASVAPVSRSAEGYAISLKDTRQKEAGEPCGEKCGEQRHTVCSPAAAAWAEDILCQLHYDRMADKIISTSVAFEKPVDPLWIAIAMCVENLLPHTTVGGDLVGGQHGDATAWTK